MVSSAKQEVHYLLQHTRERQPIGNMRRKFRKVRYACRQAYIQTHKRSDSGNTLLIYWVGITEQIMILVCACVCMCMRVCAWYVCAWVYVCTWVCVCVCVCMYVCVCPCMCVCMPCWLLQAVICHLVYILHPVTLKLAYLLYRSGFNLTQFTLFTCI